MCATRRSFLGKAAAAAVITASSLKSWGQEGERELTTSEMIGQETMNSATPQTFEQWIGGTFKIKLRGTAWGSLELVKVESKILPRPKSNLPEDQPPAHPNGNPLAELSTAMLNAKPGTVPEVQSMVLWFKRRHTPLFQENWTVEHDWLGTFDLLLVPSRPRRGSTWCLAVLTRFTGRMVPNSR